MLRNVFLNLPEYVPFIMIFAGIALLILIIVTGYVKAPPDKAYIISGLRRTGSCRPSVFSLCRSSCFSGSTSC